MYSVLEYRGLMAELVANRTIKIEINDVRYFLIYCRIHGVYPNDGGLTDDHQYQYLYI